MTMYSLAENHASPKAKALTWFQDHGYIIESNGFEIGRPDGTTWSLISPDEERVVTKLLPPDRAERTFQNMAGAWNSSFGRSRAAPGLPQPIEFLPEISAIIMENVPGKPLAMEEKISIAQIDASMELLADLHDSNAHPLHRRTSRKILRSARRKQQLITDRKPACAGIAERAVSQLEKARVADHELVPSHGDFSPRNILVGTQGSLLLDWDRFQWAAPARDLAAFGAWSWGTALRRGEVPSWTALGLARDSYLRFRNSSFPEKHLRFHQAASLIRMAASIVLLWPSEENVVPEFLAESIRLLK